MNAGRSLVVCAHTQSSCNSINQQSKYYVPHFGGSYLLFIQDRLEPGCSRWCEASPERSSQIVVYNERRRFNESVEFVSRVCTFKFFSISCESYGHLLDLLCLSSSRVSMSCNLLEFGKDLRLALSVDHDFHRQERIVAACLQSRQRDGLLDPSRHQDLKDRTVVRSSKYYIWPQPSSPQTLICQTVLVRRYVFAAQEDAVARAWIEMWPVIAPEVLVLCL